MSNYFKQNIIIPSCNHFVENDFQELKTKFPFLLPKIYYNIFFIEKQKLENLK